MDHEEISHLIEHLFKTRSILIDTFLPKDAKQHFYTAKKGALLGMRDVFQHAIDEMDNGTSKEIRYEKPKNKSIKITE